MRAKTINEMTDYPGWFTPKKSPFERAKEYSMKQELLKELQAIIKNYKNYLKDDVIEECFKEVIKEIK